MLGGDDGEKIGLVTRENLWEAVFSPSRQLDDWHLSTGYKSMRPGDMVWIVDTTPPRGIVAVAEAVEIYQTPSGTWAVDLLWLRNLTSLLRDNPIAKGSYGQTAQTVNRANVRTSAILNQWLASTQPPPSGPGRAPTEEERKKVLRAIAQRQGQSAFRTGLLEIYSYRCAISGTDCVEVLEAAHIVPYADGGAMDWRNGVILRSDIHTLFDLYLITIDEFGGIHVAPEISSQEYRKFHGMKARLPIERRHRPTKTALRIHDSAFRSNARKHISG